MSAHTTSSVRKARRGGRRVPVAIVVVGLILTMILAAAVLAPWIAPADPTRQALLMRLKPPGTIAASGQIYLLGTDDLGRDLLSRVLFGAQASLSVATLSVLVSTLVGVTLGMVACYGAFAVAALGDHDIPRLQIAMYDPGGVGRGQSVGDLHSIFQNLGQRQCAARQSVRERLSLEKLHDDVVLADVVERADVGM